ncbi:MAG: RsiV family protein [Oscillospiraceae bacterium]|nr:RsiV family protein [Oscillospiraceae bacterium]
MKNKAIFCFLLFAMGILVFCGCQIILTGEDQTSSETDQSESGLTDLAPEDQTDTQEAEQSSESTNFKEPVIGEGSYRDFMRALNGEIAGMDELFYQEDDIDGDGNIEIIAAFGQKASDIDTIMASFALRDKNGNTELLKQDFCEGGGYECSSVQFARFGYSEATFIVVGVTNHASMNGLAIYQIAGNEVVELARAASPTGSCNAYLSDEQSDGSYGGFTQSLSGYDVFYYPVTTFYKFENGRFEAQESSVDVGDYPKLPEDVVIEYLALNCLAVNYYSLEGQNRIYELADYGPWRPYGIYGYGSLDTWYRALNQYLMKTELSDEPSILLIGDISGEANEIAMCAVVMKNPQMAEEVTLNYEMVYGYGKWHIVSSRAFVSIGIEGQNIHFETYPVQKRYHINLDEDEYIDAIDFVDLDLSLPSLEGDYAGLSKINEYFAGKEIYFYGQLPYEDALGPAENVENVRSGYYRSASYSLAAKIGDIVSISAHLDGWFGGVGWDGMEGAVFDLKTGNKLGLSDIFKVTKDEYIGYIYDFVAAEIAKTIAEYGDNWLYFFENPYSDEGYEAINYFNEDDFYLTDDSLVVFYDKYTLAAGAAGIQVFYIPYDSIRDMLAISFAVG